MHGSTKNTFLDHQIEKGTFKEADGDILGGSLCFYAIFTKIHIAVCLFLISTNQDHNTKLNR